MEKAEDEATCLLFSYGTLCQKDVQVANFGRLLEGEEDCVPGYRTETITLTDEATIALSGTNRHSIMTATGKAQDRVEGTVFRITVDELAAADAYEVSDYTRVEVELGSGRAAWAYVRA